jgi:hypothetical protein
MKEQYLNIISYCWLCDHIMLFSVGLSEIVNKW